MSDIIFLGHRCANPAALASQFISGAYHGTEVNPIFSDFIVNNEGQVAFDPVEYKDGSVIIEAKHMLTYDRYWLGNMEPTQVVVYVYNPRSTDSVMFILQLIQQHLVSDYILVSYDWPSQGISSCDTLLLSQDQRLSEDTMVVAYNDDEGLQHLMEAVSRKIDALHL